MALAASLAAVSKSVSEITTETLRMYYRIRAVYEIVGVVNVMGLRLILHHSAILGLGFDGYL